MLSGLIPDQILEFLILPLLLLLVGVVGRLLAGSLVRVPMHDFVERALFYCLLGIIAISWVGVILACLGLFRWWLLLALMLILVAVSQWTSRQGAAQEQPLPEVEKTPLVASLLMVCILVAASWLYAKPAETFLLTTDASVYTIGGIVLARDGTLAFDPQQVYDHKAPMQADFWDDPVAVPKLSYSDFLQQFSYMETAGPVLSRHYGPFFQWSIFSGRLELGFLPFPKVWAALCAWLFGDQYAIWNASVFGVLGLAAIYALARRLFGWPVGLGAALFLGVSLPQLWFSRFPISEIHTQVLILAGLYFAHLARRDQERHWAADPLALASALSLASIITLRFEGILLLGLVASLVVAGRYAIPPGRIQVHERIWLTSLLIASGLGMVLSLSVAPLYYATRSLSLLALRPARYGLAILTIATLIASALLARGLLTRLIRWASLRLRLVVSLLWLAWGALAIWALLTRPLGSSLAGWLAQYWTRPGVAVSILGALWMLLAHRERSLAPELGALLGLAGAFLLLFSASALVNPVHPWAMRRLVPFVFPSLALCAGVAIGSGRDLARAWSVRLWPRSARVRWAWTALAVLTVAVLAFTIGQRTWPLLSHREREGMWSQLRTFADRFPANAVLLFDDGEIGWRMTQVNELVFGRPSYVLQDTESISSDSPVTDRLISSALDHGRPVYYVITGEGAQWRSDQWQLVGEGEQRFDVPVLVHSHGRPPNANDLTRHVFRVEFYRVLPTPEYRAVYRESPIVPAGLGSYPYLVSGFYALETSQQGAEYRWTDGNALLTLPWPESDPQGTADFCLSVDLSGLRPPSETPAQIKVLAEGVTLFEGELDLTVPRTVLNISGEAIQNIDSPKLEITLTSDTWNPAAVSQGQDQRELGVVFYGLELSPGAECPP